MAKKVRYEIATYDLQGQLHDWEYPGSYLEGVKKAKQLSLEERFSEVCLCKIFTKEDGFNAGDEIRDWTRVYKDGKPAMLMPF